MRIQKRIGYTMIAIYANILLFPTLLDWWRVGGDRVLLFWSVFVGIAVFLATKD